MGEQLGLGRIADVEYGEPTVAPGGIGEVAGDESVVQREAPLLGPTRRLAAARPHAGNPPLADDLGPGWLRQVDDRQHLVGELGIMDPDAGVRAATYPDAIRDDPS